MNGNILADKLFDKKATSNTMILYNYCGQNQASMFCSSFHSKFVDCGLSEEQIVQLFDDRALFATPTEKRDFSGAFVKQLSDLKAHYKKGRSQFGKAMFLDGEGNEIVWMDEWIQVCVRSFLATAQVQAFQYTDEETGVAKPLPNLIKYLVSWSRAGAVDENVMIQVLLFLLLFVDHFFHLFF